MSPLAGPGTPPAAPRHTTTTTGWNHHAGGSGTPRSVSDRLSWPGHEPTTGGGAVGGATAATMTATGVRKRRFQFARFVQTEWASVMVWVLTSVFLAVTMDFLVLVDTIVAPSLFHFLPAMLRSHDRTPGLLLSNGLVLLAMEQWLGSCPNVLIRLAEFQLGRVSKRGMVAAMVIHGIGAAALVTLLQRGLSEQAYAGLAAVDPATTESSSSLCACVGMLVKEMIVSTIFSVLYLVVPTLLKLNRFPIWILLLVLYPLYVAPISNDPYRTSHFSPLVTFLSGNLMTAGSRQVWRVAAQCLGGLLGGRIMSIYFPDGPRA